MAREAAATPAQIAQLAGDLVAVPPPRSLFRETVSRLRHDRVAMVGFVLLLIPVSMCFLAVFAPFDVAAIDTKHRLSPPGGQFLLGTDGLVIHHATHGDSLLIPRVVGATKQCGRSVPTPKSFRRTDIPAGGALH